MNTRSARFVVIGGLLAALAVGLGAIGAHALKTHLNPQQMETYQTAVHYQMLHAVGLVLVGLLIHHRPNRRLRVAGYLMLLGILLFSGGLYAWLASGLRAWVHVVPVGGTAFIASWLLVTLGAMGLEQ